MPIETVRAWAETVTIPTYLTGAPEKNPMFLEKRVYQGSSGVVYPYPVIDQIFDEKVGKNYTALFLENTYLKIMVLPELGGRVQMALDKTNDYHFIYYNRVIKPALVGLAGPWISGGIEFNWPIHHRPSTFSPLDWRIDEGTDGSRTVWCAEIERMSGMKGMHGFTLYPNRAILEVRVQLYNRTAEPQTFLWWANAAVHANDNTQSVFPPDVHAVMDHGRRDVSDFPIATGTYYKVDYAPGTDISRYTNLPVPTSFMACCSDFDFLGNYDYAAQAGMLHVADHHIVPGKKQWTWGSGDFGRAWDRQLTDEDGPYMELMCGAFSKNQPDFSWIMPGEEKAFSQVFLPFKRIGPPKIATRELAANLEVIEAHSVEKPTITPHSQAGQGKTARIGVYAAWPRKVHVELYQDGRLIFQKEASLSPETVFIEEVPIFGLELLQSLTLRIMDGETELVAYTPPLDEKTVIPDPAAAPRPPQEIAANEELFLTGLHLEQIRHASSAPEPYYEEALRRDPLDSRCNNALGRLLFQRGRFAESEAYFRRAIESLTRQYSHPYDGEPAYNLGRSLKMQGRYHEAFDAFYMAAWNAAWASPAWFELARLASRGSRYREALELVDNSLRTNASHHKARHLKIALLRRLGREDEALREAEKSLDLDRVEYGALWERRLLGKDESFMLLAGKNTHTYIELALDYTHAGMFDEAAELLKHAAGNDPMLRYFLGWVYSLAGKARAAVQSFKDAADLVPGASFPIALESVLALEEAMYLNPMDAFAPYHLGNFWYAHRRYAEAIECWENARTLNPSFPTVHRNLGLAYYNKLNDPGRSLVSLEISFALDSTDARVFYELDQLEKRLNRPPKERLESLEAHPSLVESRDDLSLERIMLLNLLGRHDQALDSLRKRTFHPWEGGEGRVTRQWVLAHVVKASRLIKESCYKEALEALEQAQVYPQTLGEGKLYGKLENDILYYRGCALEALGQFDQAKEAFEKAAAGLGEPASPRYFNDQPPEMIFYQGLSHYKLDQIDEALNIFRKLVDWGQAHLNEPAGVDYFAVSLPDFGLNEDPDHRNRTQGHYLMALGFLGQGETRHAEIQFQQALSLDANHVGAHVFRRLFIPGSN